MKSFTRTTLCTVMLTVSVICLNANAQTNAAEPKTEKEKFSYAIGANMAQSIDEIRDEIDLSMLQKGMTDKFSGKDLMVSAEEARELFKVFNEKLTAKKQEENAKAAKINMDTGQAFLTENKTKEGVVTTDSGLQYKILKEGQGNSPGKSDNVKVHYEGTKLDGTVFDSSYKRKQPATFQADRVISGWTEALQLMKEGGKYRLFIPSDLAYGAAGAGQQIGPNEVLIFDVELLKVLGDQPKDGKAESE